MTTLYLIRHAEAQGNKKALFQGHTNGDLSDNGKLQLERLAWRFKNVPLYNIYTSPLKRAVETAKAVNKQADLPMIFDRELIEINGGAFEGVAFNELPQKFPKAFGQWSNRPHEFVAPGGGESMKQVYDRITKVMHRLIHANMGHSIAVVSHGCVIRSYLCHVTKTPFDELSSVAWCDNTGVSRIEFDDKWNVNMRYLNDVTHLPEELSTLAKQDWWRKADEDDDTELLAQEVVARG